VYLGFGDLSRFTFLSVGFWVVMVVALAFSMVFAVGPVRGKRAARLWTDSCLALGLFGGVVDLIWVLESSEWRPFVTEYGFGPLMGMAVLAVVLLGTMWLLAIRYTDGLKD
jgi:hypothetical protein